jgi:hypothetical protein
MEMADENEPWWYSGSPDDGGSTGSRDEANAEAGDASEGVDWMAMLSGAARMVDWARGAVLDPHGEHRDPAEHPDCMICRTIVVVGDQTGMSARRDGSPMGGERDEPDEAPPIRWIPLRD